MPGGQPSQGPIVSRWPVDLQNEPGKNIHDLPSCGRQCTPRGRPEYVVGMSVGLIVALGISRYCFGGTAWLGRCGRLGKCVSW